MDLEIRKYLEGTIARIVVLGCYYLPIELLHLQLHLGSGFLRRILTYKLSKAIFISSHETTDECRFQDVMKAILNLLERKNCPGVILSANGVVSQATITTQTHGTLYHKVSVDDTSIYSVQLIYFGDE